ncbi:MAG: DUF1254 domain-containing protein [Actinobacteria bacterium]|nr:DUF1254 domain-containing protein [Actinomycetota bacterium]
MDPTEAWPDVEDAVAFAVSRVVDDPDPMNDREAADGHRYVLRVLAAVTENTLVAKDVDRPAFQPMLESTRHLGAAGPDIDYDVASLRPGRAYRISGTRGGATYVGICLYDGGSAAGPAALLDAVDVDELPVGPDGEFWWELSHPDAVRVIVRQYFHDRSTQERGEYTIAFTDGDAAPARLPTSEQVAGELRAAAVQLRWNLGLNQLWGAEHREHPNAFVRQSAAEIAAAVPNPDVTYAFAWWRVREGEALVVEHTPPAACRYWALQVCDRWFQSYPDRRSNLNDRQVVRGPDGSVRLVIAARDPGHPNWLDTGGHTTGVMFFRWLHTEPDALPTCAVVPIGEVGAPA